MRVLKFGGTSVANAERFLRVADILESNARQGQVATVLSAPAKITNHLVAMIEKTIGGQDALPNIADAERIFAELLQGLADAQPAFPLAQLKAFVEQEFAQIKHVLHGISLLGQCPDSVNAALICRGEKLSIAIMAGVLAHLKQGDHIVASNAIYGGTYNLLAHTLPLTNDVTTTFVDPEKEGSFEAAIQENTKAIFVETLGNPNSNLIDLEKVAEIAHRHNIPLVVDSTFATPYLIRPIEHGADIVVHSATKFIGGHGTTIGGVIVDGGKFDWEASGKFPVLTEPDPSYHGISFSQAAGPAAFVTRIRAILLRDTGATISPFHAFMFLQGLETLSLRVERHVENALKVVDFLSKNPKVENVNHPSLPDSKYNALYKKYFPKGAGSIFTFEIKGDAETAKKFIDHLEVFSLLANVADVKSLAIHPASTTHSQLSEAELAEQGIKPNTIRLSIGTENIDDIIYDLQEAFDSLDD